MVADKENSAVEVEAVEVIEVVEVEVQTLDTATVTITAPTATQTGMQVVILMGMVIATDTALVILACVLAVAFADCQGKAESQCLADNCCGFCFDARFDPTTNATILSTACVENYVLGGLCQPLQGGACGVNFTCSETPEKCAGSSLSLPINTVLACAAAVVFFGKRFF